MYCQYTTDTVSVAINDSYEKFTYEWFTPFDYTFSNSKDSIFFKADKNTTIVVKATGDKGCELKDTIQVNLFPTSFNQIKLNADPQNNS